MLVLILFLCLFIAVIYLDKLSKCYRITGGDNKRIIPLFLDKKFIELFTKVLKMTVKTPYVTLKDIKYKYPYKENMCFVRVSNGNGQRKLALEEIQFLTKYHNNIDILIYAGSAPGQMHGLVSNLFPAIKFILIDPNEHSINIGNNEELKNSTDGFINNSSMYNNDKVLYIYDNSVFRALSDSYLSNIYNIETNEITQMDRKLKKDIIEKIMKNNREKMMTVDGSKKIREIILTEKYRFFIIQDYFSNSLAEFLKETLSGIRYGFTSDIRSRGEKEMNIAILKNLAQQLDWTMILQPEVYKLKFRLPFADSIDVSGVTNEFDDFKRKYKIDMLKDISNGKLRYLQGEIYLQPWAPGASTETRLIGTREDLTKPFITYDDKEYSASFFYYNYIHRPFVVHENQYIDSSRKMDNCADCALEMLILNDYKNNVNKNIDIYEIVDIFNRLTKIKHANYRLKHGNLTKHLSYDDYKNLFFRYRSDCWGTLPIKLD